MLLGGLTRGNGFIKTIQVLERGRRLQFSNEGIEFMSLELSSRIFCKHLAVSVDLFGKKERIAYM